MVWQEVGKGELEACSLDILGQGLDGGHSRDSRGPLGFAELWEVESAREYQ